MTGSRAASSALVTVTGLGFWALVLTGRITDGSLLLLALAVSLAAGVAASAPGRPAAVASVVTAVGVTVTVTLGYWLGGEGLPSLGLVVACAGVAVGTALAARIGRIAWAGRRPPHTYPTVSTPLPGGSIAEQAVAKQVRTRFVELLDDDLLTDDGADAIDLLVPLALNEAQIRDVALHEAITTLATLGYAWRCAEHDSGLTTPPEILDHLQEIVEAQDMSSSRLRDHGLSERALILFRTADTCTRAQIPLATTLPDNSINGNALLHLGLTVSLRLVDGANRLAEHDQRACFRYGIAVREAELLNPVPVAA